MSAKKRKSPFGGDKKATKQQGLSFAPRILAGGGRGVAMVLADTVTETTTTSQAAARKREAEDAARRNETRER